MSGVPYIFGTATTSIPLSQLDTDFATPVTIGSTTVALGNTTTTLAGLTGVTSSAITDSGLTSGRVTYAGTGGLLQDSANLTFNGTTLTAAGFSGPISGVVTSTSITDSGLTSGRVTYAGTGGLLQDSANLTFSGTALAVTGTLSATGTLSGGTSGTGYSFSGSAPAGSLTLDSSGSFGVGITSLSSYGKFAVNGAANILNGNFLYMWSSGNTAAPGMYAPGDAFAWKNSAGTTEWMRINSTGLGIGTSSPSKLLNVYSASQDGGAILIQSGTLSNGNRATLFMSSINVNGQTGNVSIECNHPNNQQSDMVFRTGATDSTSFGTEQMRLDTSGNLLLGGTVAANSTGGMTITVGAGGSVSTPLALRNPSTSNGAGVQISFRGSTNSGAENDYAYISMVADDTTAKTASIRFSTASGSSPTERARIDSSGNLMVGTTTANNNNTTSFAFNVANGNQYCNHLNGTASGTGYIQFIYNGTGIGSITQSGTTAVLFNVTSDQRLKENIIDAPEFGSIIDSIKVRSFDWKTDNTHQRAGFIAQELVTVAPEAVHQPIDSEEMMAVDYSKLVPMLVKEIQSLRARVAQLETKGV